MNRKQFQYVWTLAEKGSFSKASDVLGISQPSLSQYIRRIESEVGMALFDRSGGYVRLTDAGKIYIQTGRRILDVENQMQSRFSDLATFKTGTITVGIAPTRCQYLMPEIVKRFAARYPGMHLIIEERFLGSLLEDAEHGDFDLCVATLPIDEKKFAYELMMQEEIVLAVPGGLACCARLKQVSRQMEGHEYPLIDIREIAGEPYAAISDQQPTQVLMNQYCEELQFSVRTAVRCMSIETQFSMVKAGIGVALIPSSLAKYSGAEAVTYFSLQQETPTRNMVVVYRRDQYLSEPMLFLKQVMTTV